MTWTMLTDWGLTSVGESSDDDAAASSGGDHEARLDDRDDGQSFSLGYDMSWNRNTLMSLNLQAARRIRDVLYRGWVCPVQSCWRSEWTLSGSWQLSWPLTSGWKGWDSLQTGTTETGHFHLIQWTLELKCEEIWKVWLAYVFSQLL